MKPITFPESNFTLDAPEGHADSVVPLPVFLAIYPNNQPVIFSCWHASIIERIRFLFTGQMWFSIYGHNHAPILLSTQKPFKGDWHKKDLT